MTVIKDVGREGTLSSLAGVNDFALRIATVNGTGSASANGILFRALHRMGVPVSAKNVFPSNIQGMATFYEIRVNARGFTARSDRHDLVITMNPQSYADDLATVRPGGYVLYDADSELERHARRDDLNLLAVPFTQILRERSGDPRAAMLLRNIAYVGSAGALLGVDDGILAQLVTERFARKGALLDANLQALGAGADYVRTHFPHPLPIRVEPSGADSRRIIIDGNRATALGCLYAGATVAAWYPITPSTSIMDHFASYCRRYRVRDDGSRNYLIVQAEDELAALGMVVGASWNGARAFSATSGPGLSLMSELLGLAYYSEIPVVLFDVQRAGPSTGMPTRTQQADLLSAAFASHGDTKHILLFPADPHECFEFAARAFDVAERFQTPVIVLSDLDIGMNEWVVDELSWDDSYVPDRGRVLDATALSALERFSRYDDEDGDFVTPRTLPGVDDKAAYFTRGSGHERSGAYTEDPDRYRQVVDRLVRKHAAAVRLLPEPLIESRPGADLGVICMGSTALAVREAVERIAEQGIALDSLRVRAYPFDARVSAFLARHERCLVVEQDRDAQLAHLLSIETKVPPERLVSVTDYGGLPMTAAPIIAAVHEVLGREER